MRSLCEVWQGESEPFPLHATQKLIGMDRADPGQPSGGEYFIKTVIVRLFTPLAARREGASISQGCGRWCYRVARFHTLWCSGKAKERPGIIH